MLLIRASRGPSTLHGDGLIARQFIPAGTKIWEFRAGFNVLMSLDDWRQLAPSAKDQTLYYGFYSKSPGGIIPSSDDDRFANHAEDPNTLFEGEGGGEVFARRDIAQGEEITQDYRSFGTPDETGWEVG